MPRFVLEIGTEEIPPRFFASALPQLRADGAKLLDRARLGPGDLQVYATPRRLALVVEDIAERQAPAKREERGPAARVAFDDKGKPTKAAEGFARRHGVPVEKLERRDTDQGEYVFAVIEEPELPAKDALAPLLPDLIAGLSFPKSMRWGAGSLRFGRPIRWLLALVDDEVVEFEMEGLRSGRETRGHPTLAHGMHSVAEAAAYEEKLLSLFVIVNQDERRARIQEGLSAATEGAQLVDGGLLRDTAFLLEWPTAARGEFDRSFLHLPEEVLVEEMRHVQSYFPLRGQDGKLLPGFIAVRDGGKEHIGEVLAGWQNVLKAKLIDAGFFYEQDRKAALADRVEALRGVVFQEKLGTMYDKMARIRALAAEAASQLALPPEDARALDRAAYLCKADLTTEMVAELPNLQGVMGGEYARLDGEPQEVWQAIGEHYLPRFAGDDTPNTKLGRLLSVADKLDTIAACFTVSIIPTGSADPFGLRREASGVVAILRQEERDRAQRISLSLSRLLEAGLIALGEQMDVERAREQVVSEVAEFIGQRLDMSLREGGVRYDLVQAALAVGFDDIGEAERRAQALRLLAPHPDFLPTVIAATRPINISRDFEGGEADPALFREEAEKDLWDAYQRVLDEADRVSLVELFSMFGQHLRAPIDRYFEEVLVMAEDETLRRNRLAMCWQLSQLFRRIADFSLIVQA